MLIHREQLEAAEAIIRDAAAKVKVGAPTDASTTVGPVVNKSQFERIQGYIESGISQGARPVVGGLGLPEGVEKGYYVRPTVFVDVTPEMKIASEEIFGPVLSVLCYDSIDEAIEIANGTVYGLGGYVFARDPKQGYEVASRIKAGRVYLNGAPANASAPMGGYKQSGNGREMGVFGLEEYLETKALIGFEAPQDE
jgi:aldehyde dehydrogenase (NAD+)